MRCHLSIASAVISLAALACSDDHTAVVSQDYLLECSAEECGETLALIDHQQYIDATAHIGNGSHRITAIVATVDEESPTSISIDGVAIGPGQSSALPSQLVEDANISLIFYHQDLTATMDAPPADVSSIPVTVSYEIEITRSESSPIP